MSHAWRDEWRNPEFADLTLRLEVDGQPDKTQELPAHRVLLARFSPYFRSRLSSSNTFQDQAAPIGPAPNTHLGVHGAAGAAACSCSGAPDPQPSTLRPVTAVPQLVLTEHCASEEEQAAALAVLQHEYTLQLPTSSNFLQVCSKASYWQCDATVSMSLAALGLLLAVSPDMSADMQEALLNLPHTLPDHYFTTSEGGKALMQQLRKHVASRFGNAMDVMRSSEQKQQFAQLPFSLVQHWASLDSLVTDSENTVAVLLTLWADHNAARDEEGGKPALPSSQAEELSKCVRLPHLSAFFHLDALPKLWWYVAPPELPRQHACLRLGFERMGQHPDWPVGLGWEQARQVRALATIEWSLGAAQLQGMWEKAAVVNGPTQYHAGYACKPYARIHKKDGLYQLGVYVAYEYCPELDPWCTGPVTMTVHISFDVAAGGALHRTQKAEWVLVRDNTYCGFVALGLKPSKKHVLFQYTSLPIKLQLQLV